MEFLKKNWGLLLCTIVFVALMVYQVMQIANYRKEYTENESKVEQDAKWFKEMNSSGWKILPDGERLENALIAKDNEEKAVGHSDDLFKQLLRR